MTRALSVIAEDATGLGASAGERGAAHANGSQVTSAPMMQVRRDTMLVSICRGRAL